MENNHTINSFVYWVMARFHIGYQIPFQPGSDWKIYYSPATWPSYNDLHSASSVMTHPFLMDTFVYKYEISISLRSYSIPCIIHIQLLTSVIHEKVVQCIQETNDVITFSQYTIDDMFWNEIYYCHMKWYGQVFWQNKLRIKEKKGIILWVFWSGRGQIYLNGFDLAPTKNITS